MDWKKRLEKIGWLNWAHFLQTILIMTVKANNRSKWTNSQDFQLIQNMPKKNFFHLSIVVQKNCSKCQREKYSNKKNWQC
jgi:hypothetical protein